MKVFLSHAAEDKPVVEQVYLRLRSHYPEIETWLDKYEILGGDDLIEKIHKGIAESDKFLIFLSRQFFFSSSIRFAGGLLLYLWVPFHVLAS